MRGIWLLLLLGGCDQVFGLHRDPGDVDALVTPDAEIDAPSCWPFAPANYAPCDPGFPQNAQPMLEIDMTTTLDTSALESYGDNLVLIRVEALAVDPGVTWTIRGSRPVIIVVEGAVDVRGTIAIDQTPTVDSHCAPNGVGQNATNTSPGGGGGSFRALGGSGGGSAGGGATPPGDVNGADSNEPLRGGCPGGRSGDGKGGGTVVIVNGVNGGLGGGALELSAKQGMSISGTIRVNGQGGQAGDAKAAGSCMGNAHNCTSGGGGGGSGGALVLESILVSVTGTVCAVGGGGGAGGFAGAGGVGTPAKGNAGGTSLDCTVGAAGMGAGIAGGAGGGPAHVGGGGATAMGFDSGGGGGGSSGRIRILAHGDSPVLAGTVVPDPVTH